MDDNHSESLPSSGPPIRHWPGLIKWTILLFILFLITVVSLWFLARSRTTQVFGNLVHRVETKEKLVALTFDDGPSSWATDEILLTLGNQDVKATFFLVGKDIEQHPKAARKIIQAGHEVGNHSYSHRRMVFVSPGFVKDELEKTEQLLHDIGHTTHPALFRPPYGKKLLTLPYYLRNTNRTSITWDVEPESDPLVASDPERITDYVLKKTRPGSIILLHVMYDKQRKSMHAVEPIITGLKTRGYKFVTVSELLAQRHP